MFFTTLDVQKKTRFFPIFGEEKVQKKQRGLSSFKKNLKIFQKKLNCKNEIENELNDLKEIKTNQ